MKPLPRGVSALEVLIVVALVALLNLLAAQHHQVQLVRLMSRWSEMAQARDRLLLADERACATAGWGSDVAGCRPPGL